ncbi:MAG TPA: FHA domain-containing protein [Anaerolineae bacterium]|nr:FHA domain-containing protein [Anaerolineae bacterium]
MSGDRDDRTRVRMPSVSPGSSSGRAGDSDATRHVRRESGGPRPAGGQTVRMQVVPRRFGWLIVKAGARIGQVHPLGEVTDLGRGAASGIVIDDEKVSEQHARVRVDEDGQFVLWDLASTNGTFVNGEQIMAATPIVENDEVRVGSTVLVLKTLDIEA